MRTDHIASRCQYTIDTLKGRAKELSTGYDRHVVAI